VIKSDKNEIRLSLKKVKKGAKIGKGAGEGEWKEKEKEKKKEKEKVGGTESRREEES
jgi:hypothetical protein